MVGTSEFGETLHALHRLVGIIRTTPPSPLAPPMRAPCPGWRPKGTDHHWRPKCCRWAAATGPSQAASKQRSTQGYHNQTLVCTTVKALVLLTDKYPSIDRWGEHLLPKTNFKVPPRGLPLVTKSHKSTDAAEAVRDQLTLANIIAT